MTDAQVTLRPTRRRRLRALLDPWSIGAALIAVIVLAPILSVFWKALSPKEPIWAHLVSTTLPRYLGNSLMLMLSVGLVTGIVGTATAWMSARYEFPLRRALDTLLLLPLAIPAYIGAYALVDFLEYAGPIQSGLRQLFGWNDARDYWFPEIRSMGAAIIVLSAALYPYVYLLSRAAFREQSASADEVARSLGAGPFARFWRIGLPMARPAIAAAISIVMMETVNDFGTVDFFAVQTLTTGIFSVWLQSYNPGGAAQIACVILALVLALVLVEKTSRRRLRFYALSRRHRPVPRRQLSGWRAGLATAGCLVPFLLGFVLPGGVILSHALSAGDGWLDPGLMAALRHTLTICGAAAVVTLLAAIFLVYGVRLSGAALPRLLLPVTTIGYAAPGAVLAVGILIPLAALDNRVADGILALTGFDPGLMLTGTAFAVVLAYCVRFFAIAQGATDGAMGRVPPALGMAARSLGRSRAQVLRSVYFPLIRGTLASALLLVFVDSVKELPATLLLRPFNYDTLATRVFEKASLEQLGQAAPAALLVIGVGLAAVALLARTNR
ncbi:iron ABC transporter permease [Pseudooceanicola sp. HF7]|uniref:ABC transporter permease n=1 Tax=Pseudooceanicola sp. HF7 TaxID=2721560 RepID=UPI0014306218|nr:iron ABC transporter permease [Pseudooceanicola sp. HF7]NIZ09982.1 iron ABC transporter permease [Pseudooceanicola sp. HF7]